MRLEFLDTIRGIAFLLMFIFHIFIALNLFSKYNYDTNSFILNIIGLIARTLFILLLGVSLYLSYNNSKNEKDYKKKQLKRSLQLLIAGIYVTIITYIVIPDKYIVFGILHFMAIVILILYNFVNNIPILLIIFFIVIYLQTIQLNYNNDGSIISFLKGIFGFSFYKNSIDHFYILKWINIVIIGIFIGHFIKYIYTLNKQKNDKQKNDNNKQKNDKLSTNIINVIGRNTLILYIIHLPVLYFVTINLK